MNELDLPQNTINKILKGDFHEPRSVLGFQENRKKNNQLEWIIRVLEPNAEKISLNLEMSGQTFVFTGKLNQLSRSQAREAIEGKGGKVSSAVTSKTKFLVVGESPGTKLRKARDLGLELLSENEFLNKIKQ